MSAKKFRIGDKVVILPTSGFSFANEVGIVESDIFHHIIKVFVPSTKLSWSVRTRHIRRHNPILESEKYLSLFE